MPNNSFAAGAGTYKMTHRSAPNGRELNITIPFSSACARAPRWPNKLQVATAITPSSFRFVEHFNGKFVSRGGFMLQFSLFFHYIQCSNPGGIFPFTCAAAAKRGDYICAQTFTGPNLHVPKS